MNIDGHNQAEELLGAMLELPPEEHDAFLDDQCGSDAALRADVDKLRLAHERGNGNPATAAAPAAAAAAAAPAPVPATAPATAPDTKDDPDKGSFVEQLLSACPDQLWEIPAGDARTMPGSPVPDNLPPSLGKRYQIERELGRGGMGRVYLAGDKKLKRKVALKMLPEVCTSEPRRRAMFEREACTAANLNHANVATVYEFEEFDGKPCISMEYVEGRPLREVLEDEQPMPTPRLLDIALQITEGLHAAHRRSIIHRDLKPANVMVTDEGLVKILDFGLAKALHAGVWDADTRGGPESVGSSGVLLGTPGYMSPEQARREDDVDERTDLFSLGIVLYEMATGDGPFHRHTPEECISAALNEEPRPVTALNSNLPTAVADVINKLLEKGKGDRYQSAEEVLEDLRELVAAQEAGRKKGLLKWLLAAAMVVLAVGGVERIFRKPPEPAAKTITWIRSCAKQDLFGKAWEGYARLQHSHGKEHPTVEMLLGYVRKEERRFLQARRKNLERSLVGGRFEQAEDALARIKHLAEISTPTGARAGGQDTPDVVLEQARDLFKRAERKKRDVEGLVRDTGGLLTKGQFPDAWQQIVELEKIQFDNRLFTPATRARDSLRTQLADEIVRWVEQVTLDNITRDNAELLKTYFDLLQTVDPSNDALERFQRKTIDAQREVRMAEHYVEASKSDIQLARLRDIHGEMELLGPKDRRTEEISNRLARKEAEDKLERTQKQLWEDLVREFEKGRVAPLGRTIAKAREKGVDRLALDRADHALTWLKTLRDVKPHGNNTGLARKQYARLVTRAPRLDAPFRDAAQRHLRELDDALRLEEAKATANAIYIGIQNSCKKRRVKEAVAQL
ncbi:MAG: serine/threonine protein kinase, partial [Planctomycetota bacterium]